MIRSDLISRLAKRFPQLTASDITFAVKTLLEAMSNQLAQGGRIEVRGFGSFSVHTRPSRRGRNPKTGETVAVREKRVPHFRAGALLREGVLLWDGVDE